jgi:hypothetical protein
MTLPYEIVLNILITALLFFSLYYLLFGLLRGSQLDIILHHLILVLDFILCSVSQCEINLLLFNRFAISFFGLLLLCWSNFNRIIWTLSFSHLLFGNRMLIIRNLNL